LPSPPGHHLPTVVETAPDGTTWEVLADWSEETTWPLRGTVVSTTLHGTASGLSELAWVYLPAAYFQPRLDARNLPITIVFGGYPGHPDNLITRQHYPESTRAGIAAGTVAPTVLVMLTPSVTFPWDTECSDIPDGPQAFTFYSQDVPDAAVEQFHLHPDGYAAIGDSTGGYCAAKLQSLDPTRFTVAASLSGYYRPATDPTTHGAFADTGQRRQNDLGWRLRHLPVPAVSLLLATARDETGPDGWTTNETWLHLIQHPMTAEALVLDHGGHNYASWNREVPYALSWISGRLPHSHTLPASVPTEATVESPGSPLGQSAATSSSARPRIESNEPARRSQVASGRRPSM
jgi:S-formylglutathione hydrolase FrmB